MTIDALIFDLDGTLWDCSAASAEACNRLYQSYGLEKVVTAEFIRTISGRPASECDEILFAEIVSQPHEEVFSRAATLEIAALQKCGQAALYPGVEEGIRVLSQRYQLFLVSNCSARYLETFRSCTALEDFFADTECFGSTLLPKAQNIKLIIERNNLRAPCYIGDTAGDEEAARVAGVPFFFAQYGFGQPKEPKEAFDSFYRLTDFFMSLETGQHNLRECRA